MQLSKYAIKEVRYQLNSSTSSKDKDVESLLKHNVDGCIDPRGLK